MRMNIIMKKNIINISDCLVPIELKKIRENKMIPISEVSEETGLSASVISNIEHNKNVNFISIVKYADYLGYDIVLKKKKPERIIDI